MIQRYTVDSLILKTKFKYHEEYKQNILNYIKEDKSSSFKKKDEYYNDNLLRDDWLQSSNWERPWIKYAGPDLQEHLLMFAQELGYQHIDIKNLWYQQYGYKGIHNWHIHGGNYTGVYYLEYDDTCPLTEFVYPNNMEKSFSIEHKEGDMLFFPCFLMHRSPISQTNNRKSIISWNLEFEKIQKKYLNNRPVEKIK
tara:strand:- start:243 stop:830 length:588 start_codon:yes stop_codon:yes gene_type:complete